MANATVRKVCRNKPAIPGFERKPASHLLVNETTCKCYTGIEPLHEANPKDQIRSTPFYFGQMDTFFNAHAKRLFDQDVLAGGNRSSRGRDMELIGDSYDHRFNLRIGKQFVILAIDHLRFPDLRHPVPQVVRGIANGVQSRVSGFLAALEMSGPGNHSTSKNTYTNGVRGLFHVLRFICSFTSNTTLPKDFTTLIFAGERR
jgi:hypothetical protein